MHFSKALSFYIFTALVILVVPHLSHASEDLEVSGWIPYWNDTSGIKDAKKHLGDIDRVLPFAFTVTTQGELRDQAGLGKRDWKSFIKTAKRKDVEVVPTVMWSDRESIHAVLSATSSRTKHIEGIVKMVEKGRYDGVDIDYEAKKAETINYYSQFLKELKKKLDGKLLTCTVEARTPPDSLYKVIPVPLVYANDYKEIGKYCDRVEIMGYDQQRADIKLNAKRTGEPYMPLSDVDWVRKVVALAVTEIPKEKLILGIPTYGHHYSVTVAPDWYKDYQRIGALNVSGILEIAEEYKATPSRNKGGEMSFTYVPKSSDLKLPKSLKIPKDTPKGNIVAARALAYANKTGQTVSINYALYSDAGAMGEKIDLAEEFGLRGIALFKIDGGEDQDVWERLSE